jgi:hypothetical protein
MLGFIVLNLDQVLDLNLDKISMYSIFKPFVHVKSIVKAWIIIILVWSTLNSQTQC